jgi:hypothetical protein
VIRDGDEWRDVWKTIFEPSFRKPRLPEIDFSREMVVVVGLGERPSSGYKILIDSAYERDDQLEIGVFSESPGHNCVALTVMTQPVDIAVLPKVERSVVFRETDLVHECK